MKNIIRLLLIMVIIFTEICVVGGMDTDKIQMANGFLICLILSFIMYLIIYIPDNTREIKRILKIIWKNFKKELTN